MAGTSPQIPEIVLPTSFQLRPVPGLPASRLANLFAPPLRALAAFHGTWSGHGFNLIFRPQSRQTPTKLPNRAQGPSDNILEINLTEETIAFSPSLGSVPNRGLQQGDIFLNGVPYVQTVSDITDGARVPIHFEPGIWLSVPATSDPAEAASLVRMASIPHGTTINLQGTSSDAPGAPIIPPSDPTPFLSATGVPFRFPSQDATDPNTFRIPQDLTSHIASGAITQAILDDPNTVLRNAIAGRTITKTTTIEVASTPEIPPGPLTGPSVGGGTGNIGFLVGRPPSGPNADVPVQQSAGTGRVLAGVKSTFWIETVEHVIQIPAFELGQPPLHLATGLHHPAAPTFVLHPPFTIREPTMIRLHSTQIQYSQIVLLNFFGITWPHVSVATLTPTTPISPPSAVWDAIRP